MISKFLNLSTNGHRFTERTKRILAVILYPVWAVGLAVVVILTIQGLKAIPLFYRAKSLIPKQKELENLARNKSSNQSSLQYYDFDPTPWKEIGIKNPTPASTMMPQVGMAIQRKEMFKCLSPLIYFVICFVLPAIILRLKYWVDGSNKRSTIY